MIAEVAKQMVLNKLMPFGLKACWFNSKIQMCFQDILYLAFDMFVRLRYSSKSRVDCLRCPETFLWRCSEVHA